MRVSVIITAFFLCAGLSARAQDIYDAADSLNKHSVDLLKQGKYAEALDSVKALLNLLDVNPDRFMKAKALGNAAICYKELGAYDKADACYRKSIDLADSDDIDLYRFNYSNYLLFIGNWQKAIACLSDITGEEYEFRKLLNLSTAYFRRKGAGDAEKAISLLDEFLSSHDTTDVNYPIALQNKGYILWDCDEQDSALHYLREAEKLMPAQGGEHHITLATIAVVQANLHDFDNALANIDTAMRWFAAHIDTYRHDYIIALRKKAEILLKARKFNEAVKAFSLYYEQEKAFIYGTFPDALTEYRLNYWYSQKPFLSEIFQLKDADPTFLYDVALFRRQMTLLGSSPSIDIKRETDIGVDKLKRAMHGDEAAIEFVCFYDETAKDTLYAALLATPGTAPRYIPIDSKSALHGYKLADGSTLESGICSLGSKVKGVIYTDSALAGKIWGPICKALPKKIRKLYFAPDGMLQMLGIENLPFDGLTGIEIHRLTSTANLLNRTASDTNLSKRRALVIGGVNYDATATDSISDEANVLAYNYLTDECGINVSHGLFSYLQGSRTEADSIVRKLPSVDNGEDGRSTEGFLKKHLADYALVHLSTHGYSLKVNVGRLPSFQSDSLMVDNTLLASGIALSGANVAGQDGAAEDGLLSARELCDMDGLDDVDLIVLSACQTAQGVVSDEGPAGVVRGLKKAGVRSIMASLWPVNDDATALFMNAFYNALSRDGCSKYDALRRAQDAVRSYIIPSSPMRFSPKTMSSRPLSDDTAERQEFKPYKDPYFWAPFILIDDI